VTAEDAWARIRFEVHRLASLIAEHAHLIDRAEHRITDLEDRVDRLEHDDD
jgi:hypothetical protein